VTAPDPYTNLAVAILEAPVIEDTEARVRSCLKNWFDLDDEDWRLNQATKEIMEVTASESL
jgi:hypothetical protein